MAGMATRAPTGTATRPPATSATSHGTPEPVRWPTVVAPRAAKDRWQSDSWPDVQSSSASEPRMTTRLRALVHRGR